MKRRVILRADAGKQTGYGHFVRTLALANYLCEDFNCAIATCNHDSMQPSRYQLAQIERVCEYLPVDGSSIEEFNDSFRRMLTRDDIAVLDNYYFTTEYQQQIREAAHRLVCIDDMHNRHMVADVVFTPCPLKREDFSLEPYTLFYGGIERCFLRPEFLTPTADRVTDGKIRRVALAMGGADPYGLTDRMAETVLNLAPDVELEIIAGDTVATAYESEEGVKVYRRVSADKIKEIFDSSDLGIFPASTICVEAFSRQLPVAAGYYVDNQADFYRYGKESCLFVPLGSLLSPPGLIADRLRPVFDGSIALPRPVFNFKSNRDEIKSIFRKLSC